MLTDKRILRALAQVGGKFKPAAEQLDQLLLPMAWLDGGVAELIGGDGDQNTSAGSLL